MNTKHIFLGFIERQERLSRGWDIELGVLTFLCVSSLAAFRHGYGILAWVPLYALVTIIMAIASICKLVGIYRLSEKAALIMSRHKSEKLRTTFSKSRKYLEWIILLDILYPATWPFSVLFKLAFVANTHKIRELIGY